MLVYVCASTSKYKNSLEILAIASTEAATPKYLKSSVLTHDRLVI